MQVRLGRDGWPDGDPEVWLDLNAEGWRPDGSVVDAEGALWNAQWGGARVARYAADGTFLSAVGVGATQATCPAFGGPDLATLYCTSADDGAPDYAADTDPAPGAPSHDPRRDHGRTFAIEGAGRGLPEYRVIL
jgi:sugar lactone lactonase YvrE